MTMFPFAALPTKDPGLLMLDRSPPTRASWQLGCLKAATCTGTLF